MAYQPPAGVTVTGYDVQNTGRQTRIVAHLGKIKCAQARVLSWFQYDGVTRRQGRRHFPGQHEQRKIPRNDLTDHAERFRLWQLFFDESGPARMMVKMTGDQRNINITGFTDRFTVIKSLDHRQNPCVLLHLPRQSVKMASPSFTA